MLAHFDHFGCVDDRHKVLNAAEIGHPGKGRPDVVVTPDELHLVAEITRGADRALDRRRWRMVTAHCVQRHTQHAAEA